MTVEFVLDVIATCAAGIAVLVICGSRAARNE